MTGSDGGINLYESQAFYSILLNWAMDVQSTPFESKASGLKKGNVLSFICMHSMHLSELVNNTHHVHSSVNAAIRSLEK